MTESTPNQNFSKDDVVKWHRVLEQIQRAFPSPWLGLEQDQLFENAFKKAIMDVSALKHPCIHEEQESLKGYLGPAHLPDYSMCTQARLSANLSSYEQVIDEIVELFKGMPNWNHPQTMSQVIPPTNTASIIGASLCKLFNPDIMEGEYSWNIAKAEIESGAMLADLMGWDPEKSGGIYTFGGTSSYLYALKLAITSVLGIESRYKGVRADGQLLVAQSGHYAKHTCADWSGLGIENVREIAVDADNRMDIHDLQKVMEACRREGKPVVMIVCTTGSTDAFAIDPIMEVRHLIERYENAGGHPKPFLYADSVIGWPWMTFKNYDMQKNPLEFSYQALSIIRDNYTHIAQLSLVDAMGVDFHKTGWAPFNSSFFLVKDYERFTSMLSRPLPPYIQLSTHYNPFIYTLETSRSASGAVAGWASLKLFGYEGYQVLLGKIVELALFFRSLLEKEKTLICVNPENFGFVTLFRVYPRHVDARIEYERELNDPSYGEAIKAYNNLQRMVANKLFNMLRDPQYQIPGWESPPYTSYTQGFRPPRYETDDSALLIHALKAYPMSPFSNKISFLILRNYVLKARDLVIEELSQSVTEMHSDEEASVVAPQKEKVSSWFGESKPILWKYLTPQPMTVKSVLATNSLLSTLNDQQLTDLIGCAQERHLQKDEVLFKEGDRVDHVYIIASGKVMIFKNLQDGTVDEIATLEQGSILGEMAIFAGGMRSASAKAIEETHLLSIPGTQFLAMIV